MKKLRVLVLMHPDLVPPDDLSTVDPKEAHVFKTEYDVVSTLRGLGHDVRPLGVQDELRPIRDSVDEFAPHIVFNLLEEFHGLAEFDQHVVSYLELLRVPYSGCNPRGLVIGRGKALAKKILGHHRIRTPAFMVVAAGRKPRRTKGLEFPLIVKSATADASEGISQASIVDSDEKLADRVRFIHETVETDAIVEQYIDGREIYVGVLGNSRVTVLPVWELSFDKLPEGKTAIATAKVKHDPDFQKQWGIMQGEAEGLDDATHERIVRTTKRIYRLLELDGYARIDYRLTEDGTPYFLEANPNPEISEREEFSQAAQAYGFTYPELLQRILNLGLQRRHLGPSR